MLRTTPRRLSVPVFILFALFAANSALAELPKSLVSNPSTAVIAILSQSDFVPDRTGIPSVGFPDALADRVMERLAKSKRFIPAEREALRRVVLEQRFGQRLSETYLDRTLDEAIRNLDSMESTGDRVSGTKMAIGTGGLFEGGVVNSAALAPKPVGSGLAEGEGKVGTTSSMANFNDILKDFLDMGSAAGTDFLVFGHLEQIKRKTESNNVPYSEDRVEVQNKVDARARIRIIDTENSMVLGAASFKVNLSENIFSKRGSSLDDNTVLDALANKISGKIIDLVYPARIATLDPITITRGYNDLVAIGDEYEVLREGDTVEDENNIILGKLTKKVGMIVIDQPKENFSLVSASSNDDIEVGDLVERARKSQIEQLIIGDSNSGQKNAGGDVPSLAIGKIWISAKKNVGKDSPQIFTNTLISSLANTKRFDIIDRQELDQLLTEEQATLMREGDTLPSAIGSLVGADYLILGAVTVFSVVDKEIKLPGSSKIFKKKVGVVEGNIRITDVATGVVLESRKVSVSHTLENQQENSQLLTQLADSFANSSVQTVLNAIYPLKVMAVASDGTIYLNRGIDGGLSSGDVLSVFRQGMMIVDPDSNRTMGNQETNVGAIRITEVEDIRSKAIVLRGDSLLADDVLKVTDQVSNVASVITDTASSARDSLAIRLMRMDAGLSSSGISESKLKYLSSALKARLYDSGQYTILERLDIDDVLDEKIMTSIIHNSDIGTSLTKLSEANYILIGGITSMSFENISTTIPYIDEVENFPRGNIDGVFKIVNSVTGEMKAINTVSTQLQFEPMTDYDQAQNILLRSFAEKIALALSGGAEPVASKKVTKKVSVPAW